MVFHYGSTEHDRINFGFKSSTSSVQLLFFHRFVVLVDCALEKKVGPYLLIVRCAIAVMLCAVLLLFVGCVVVLSRYC
jgi:hypothetical protein